MSVNIPTLKRATGPVAFSTGSPTAPPPSVVGVTPETSAGLVPAPPGREAAPDGPSARGRAAAPRRDRVERIGAAHRPHGRAPDRAGATAGARPRDGRRRQALRRGPHQPAATGLGDVPARG